MMGPEDHGFVIFMCLFIAVLSANIVYQATKESPGGTRPVDESHEPAIPCVDVRKRAH